MFLQPIRDAACALAGLGVGVFDDLAVGGGVVDGDGIGFYGGGAGKPMGGRQLVDVMAVDVFAVGCASELASEGGETAEGDAHDLGLVVGASEGGWEGAVVFGYHVRS